MGGAGLVMDMNHPPRAPATAAVPGTGRNVPRRLRVSPCDARYARRALSQPLYVAQALRYLERSRFGADFGAPGQSHALRVIARVKFPTQ